MAALRELVRLLRPGGRALIYVWAMEQEYNKRKSKYLKVKRACKSEVEDLNSDAVKETGDKGSQSSVYPNEGVTQFKGRCCNVNEAIHSKLPIHTNRTSFDSQDLLVPWHLKDGAKKNAGHTKPHQSLETSARNPQGISPVLHRYYHVFCERELELACKDLDGIKLQESYYDQGNWCVVLEKALTY